MNAVTCTITFTEEEISNLFDYQPCEDTMVEFVHALIDTKTEKKCPRCGKFLYNSDVNGYDYVCYNCDENFYKCEV